MTKAKGFTLIEMVIAVTLASFVMLGVATIAAQMARSQVEGIRSGTSTGWSLISYGAMVKEIEDSNVLAFPIADNAVADQLILCKNWSRAQGGPLPGAKLNTNALPAGSDWVSVIQYCVDSADPANLLLRRYANVGAGVACPCPGAPAACNAAPVACSAAPPGTWTETGVIGFRLEKHPSFTSVFRRDNSIGGVRVRYVIGRQTPTPNDPTPKNTVFNFGVAMQKQFTSTFD